MRERENLWHGLSAAGQAALTTRDYSASDFARQLAETGVEAGKIVAADRTAVEVRETWIPGVEIFARAVFPQRHRGFFGEFARQGEGIMGRIGFWPRQWATARMFTQTAKGFHVHPPALPADVPAADWFRRLFVDEAENYALRRYDEEQWDAMFIVQGVAEMILRDLRAGLPNRTMRLFIEGDDQRGPNNVGVIIPPGVAHALRVEGSQDLIMVYGTSTSFRPEFEGRIASEVETATLPESWQRFLAQ
jgi:dTDP-4-dehydrorhamnose 3,5-epimerase-like enzyme